jgi:hypothetical protein
MTLLLDYPDIDIPQEKPHQRKIAAFNKTLYFGNRIEYISVSRNLKKRVRSFAQPIDGDDPVSPIIIKNTIALLQYLGEFAKIIPPEEIGPSPNGTMLMCLENQRGNLVIDMGERTWVYVFRPDKRRSIARQFEVGDFAGQHELLEALKQLSL